MTVRKSDVKLPQRTPAYVSREIGAAEVGISPETWDRWVHQGVLPAPAAGFPGSTPRWRWADIERKLQGKSQNDADAFVNSAGAFRNGAKKVRRHSVAEGCGKNHGQGAHLLLLEPRPKDRSRG